MIILVSGMCSICYHMALVLAFMHLYSTVFLICDCFCPFLKTVFLKLVLKRQTERSMVPSIVICLENNCFYKNNSEGTNFRINMFVCFMFVKCACVVLYSTSVRFDLVKSPEVTLCGLTGL